MKLTKQLSTKHFITAHLIILSAGLLFLFGLFYILNIQYQKPKQLFSNGPVTSAPKSLMLSLDQPDDDSLTFQSSIIISGKTAALADVLISTDSNDFMIKSKADGSFSTILNLDEGINKITAVVFDPRGDSRFVQKEVYFSKEKI